MPVSHLGLKGILSCAWSRCCMCWMQSFSLLHLALWFNVSWRICLLKCIDLNSKLSSELLGSVECHFPYPDSRAISPMPSTASVTVEISLSCMQINWIQVCWSFFSFLQGEEKLDYSAEQCLPAARKGAEGKKGWWMSTRLQSGEAFWHCTAQWADCGQRQWAVYCKTAGRNGLECFHHKESTKVWGQTCVYLDLNIT